MPVMYVNRFSKRNKNLESINLQIDILEVDNNPTGTQQNNTAILDYGTAHTAMILKLKR
jgi:hypothetical protein